MQRAWSITSSICAIALVALVGLLAYGFTSIKPATMGLKPESFADAGRDAVAIDSLVTVEESERRRPNIVIILADDLGYGDLGVQGTQSIATPNMDRLAREGMRFTQFYASAPLCSPSRAGLLTGRYPLRSGFTTAMQMAGDTPMRKAMYQAGLTFSHLASVDVLGGRSPVLGLPPSEITMPELLHAAGYRTMAIGKWHLGDFTAWPEYHPFNHGFDEFVGFNGSNDDFPVAFWRGDTQVVADIGADQAKYTGLFTQEAVAFIERQKGAPFFLYLAHKDPHLPFFPSEAFAGKSDGGPYGDAVSELDWSVGEVVDTIQRLGLANDTLVLLTSDNGPWFDGSPGGLRGRKGQSYEGGFRVPLVAWWPGHVPADTTSHSPAMNIDFLPTCAALAGVSLPADRVIDGVDLSAVLFASGTAETPADRPLFFFHEYDVEALRKGPWKYYASVSHYTWPVPLDKPNSLVGPLAGSRDYHPANSDITIPTLGTWPLLYRLDLDADESYNVTKSHPEVSAALGRELVAWRDEFYANPRGWKER